MLARGHPGLDADVALVAGLVHDIGHIPLLIKACNYENLIANPEGLDKILYKLHTQLGGSILKLWKFDPQVVAVAAEHENLQRNPGDAPVDYVDLIQVANIQSHEGSEHRLAKVDRSTVKAFARIEREERGGEESTGIDEDTKQVEDIIF